jgi:hypothetical protein
MKKSSKTYNLVLIETLIVMLSFTVVGPLSVIFGWKEVNGFFTETGLVMVGLLIVILGFYFTKEEIKHNNNPEGYTDVEWLSKGKPLVTFGILFIILEYAVIGPIISIKYPAIAKYFSSMGYSFYVLISALLSIFVLNKRFKYKFGTKPDLIEDVTETVKGKVPIKYTKPEVKSNDIVSQAITSLNKIDTEQTQKGDKDGEKSS